MRKHILKTALISFAAAIGALVLFVAVCMLFFPSAVSDVAFNMGLTDISCSFSEKAYAKSSSDGDLKKLVERAIMAENHALVSAYADDFIECDSFDGFVQAEDEGYLRNGSYYGYITGNYAVSLYHCGDKDGALEVAVRHTHTYSKYNATEYLIFAVILSGDREFAPTLLAEIQTYAFTGDEAELLEFHVAQMQAFING